MEQNEQSGDRDELLGSAIIAAILNALISFIVGVAVNDRFCPGWILILLLATPFLLSKVPMEFHLFWFGEYGRAEDNRVRNATIIGGFVGIGVMGVMAICFLFIAWSMFMSRL